MQRYLDILEQTFLIRRLPPFFRNIGKRLTKAPKLYLERDLPLLGIEVRPLLLRRLLTMLAHARAGS